MTYPLLPYAPNHLSLLPLEHRCLLNCRYGLTIRLLPPLVRITTIPGRHKRDRRRHRRRLLYRRVDGRLLRLLLRLVRLSWVIRTITTAAAVAAAVIVIIMGTAFIIIIKDRVVTRIGIRRWNLPYLLEDVGRGLIYL